MRSGRGDHLHRRAVDAARARPLRARVADALRVGGVVLRSRRCAAEGGRRGRRARPAARRAPLPGAGARPRGCLAAPQPGLAMAGQVALTFDDGPDPAWTPRVLDELDRAGAPATFFLLASPAACCPEGVEPTPAPGQGIASHGTLPRPHDESPSGGRGGDGAGGLRLRGRTRPRLWRTPHGVVAP